MTLNQQIVEVIPLFAVPLVQMKFDCGDQIRKVLNDTKTVDTGAPQMYGLRSSNTNVLNLPQCKPLADFIKMQALNMCKNILAYDIENLQYTMSWISVKQPNQYHTPHTHPNSVISGVYYFYEEENVPLDGIYFEKTNGLGGNTISIPLKDEKVKDCPMSWSYYKVNPTRDLLLLFPSYLPHRVDTNVSKIDRKSLAFNLIPTKMLGSVDELTVLKYSELK